MGLSVAGAEALSAGIGGFTSLAGSVGGGLFSANQARKNRQWQARMYEQQVKDAERFWNMQNAYDLPSAQLARIKAAGLSVGLMYGQGGQSLTAGNMPNLPSAGSGAQGSVGSFNTRVDLANLALLEAQTKKVNAEADLTAQQSEESKQRTLDLEQDVLLKRLTKDINVAIRYRDYDFLNTKMDEMRNNIFNSSMITTQNAITLAQGRIYQIKRYNLDEWHVGQMVDIGLKNIEIGKMNASAALKQAAAAWKNAFSLAALNNAQIGEISTNVAHLKRIYPELEKQTRFMTFKQKTDYVLDILTRGVDLQQKQVDIIKSKVGAVRSRLGNDSGFGSVLAPLQMPVYDPVKYYDENYGN